MRRSTSMIVKGFTRASTFTHRQTTASVHQLLAQHATNQQFSITSVTVFGNPADGPKPIRVVFSSTEDKHAAYTASKGLRSKRIYLDDDLTPVQLQERQQLSHIHTQLRQSQLRPLWRGSVLLCTEEDGELKKYKPGEVVNAPAAPQQPYPRRLNSRVRRLPAAAPNPTTGLVAASAAAAAAIAPRPAPTHSAAPKSPQTHPLLHQQSPPCCLKHQQSLPCPLQHPEDPLLSPPQPTPWLPMMLLPLHVLLPLQLLLLHFRSPVHLAFQPRLAAQRHPCQPSSLPTPNLAFLSPSQTGPPPVHLVHLASLPMQHPTSSLSAHPLLHFSQDTLKTQAAIIPLLNPHSLLPNNRKDQPANPQPRCYLFVYSFKT